VQQDAGCEKVGGRTAEEGREEIQSENLLVLEPNSGKGQNRGGDRSNVVDSTDLSQLVYIDPTFEDMNLTWAFPGSKISEAIGFRWMGLALFLLKVTLSFLLYKFMIFTYKKGWCHFQ
jgi:hypothetical protein